MCQLSNAANHQVFTGLVVHTTDFVVLENGGLNWHGSIPGLPLMGWVRTKCNLDFIARQTPYHQRIGLLQRCCAGSRRSSTAARRRNSDWPSSSKAPKHRHSKPACPSEIAVNPHQAPSRYTGRDESPLLSLMPLGFCKMMKRFMHLGKRNVDLSRVCLALLS